MDRLLASDVFRQAGQLRQLLAYLGERSLRGEAGALKEYTVGIEALQKPESYDPRKDATVRIQTGRLRTKIEEYYRTEGQSRAVRFRLPKGGFRLQLEPREADAERPPAAGPVNRWKIAALVLSGVCALSLALLAVTAGRPSPPAATALPGEMLAFWRPFFRADRTPLLVVGPNLFLYMDGVMVRDWSVNRIDDVAKSERLRAIQQAAGAKNAIHMPVYMGTGEARAMFALGRLFFRAGHDVQLRQSSEISWADFRDRAVILVGSTKSIPHLSELPDLGVNLGFTADLMRIRSVDQRPGEPAGYASTRSPDTRQIVTAYGLITRLAARRGRGDLLEISSPDTEGSLAAADYVTSPEGIRDLTRRLAAAGAGPQDSFQAVVRANVKDHVPVQVSHQALRVLADPEP